MTSESRGLQKSWTQADLILKAIRERQKFLITSHISLDGDAVCSELAIAAMLESLGKKAWIVNEGEIPHILDFLPGIETVRRWPAMPEEKWDAVFVLDLGKWSRMGKLQEAISADEDFVIDIDHHRSTTGCGRISLIEPEMSSTGELLYEFFKYAGMEFSSDVALLLYVAILTDTGRFSYDNTSECTHRNAAELIRLGANPLYVSNMVYRRQTLPQMQLFERALASLTTNGDGSIAWIVLRRRDFEETKTSALLTQEFVEVPRSLKGVKIGIFFREMEEPGKIKVSMRSNVNFDLNGFSTPYGGGGHASAAGITMKSSIEDAISVVISALEAQLAGL